MKCRAAVAMHGRHCGFLYEEADGSYRFEYLSNYEGVPISRTLPVQREPYLFGTFPPFFDGVLPEGIQLEMLLRQRKLDRYDYMGQLLAVGLDLIGALTVTSCE